MQKKLTGFVYFPPKNEVMLYDDDGNLIQDGRWVYVWDAENRLISMETTSSAVAAGVERLRLKFTYDWQGRRVRKLVQKAASATSTTWTLVRDLRYVYDGWNLLAEFSVSSAGAWAPVRSYVWGNDISGSPEGAGGIGGLLVVRVHSSTGVTNYLPCYDGNGNVVAYYHHGSKSVTATMEYDAFGRELTIDNGTLGQGSYTTPPFRFSTKYTDPETALVYYGFRYYSAEMGRWLTRDPVGENGGLNLYGMCGNDTVNEVDVLGLLIKPFTTMPAYIPIDRVDILPFNWAGLTTPRWATFATPSSQWVGNECDVQLSGELTIEIQVLSRLSGVQASSVISHERQHAEKIMTTWNNFVLKANEYEGEYTNCHCAELAAELVGRMSKYYFAKMEYENHLFDQADYGGGAVQQKKLALDFSRTQYENADAAFSKCCSKP